MPSPLARLLVLLPLVATLPAMAAGTLCLEREQALFDCPLDETTRLAICASPTLTAQTGYLQFRYGAPDHLQAAWPEANAPRTGISKGGLLYDGKLGHYLRFDVEREGYVVFTVPGAASGIVFVRDGRIIGKRLCRQPATARIVDPPVARAALFAVTGTGR